MKADSFFDIYLVVTGICLLDIHGKDVNYIIDDGFEINAQLKMFKSDRPDTGGEMVRSMARVMSSLVDELEKAKPDIVLSDGMTRGSLSDLKSSINYATRNNIDVVGIGIGERGTWKEYINHTQIFEPEELIYSIVNITKDILIKNMKENIGAA